MRATELWLSLGCGLALATAGCGGSSTTKSDGGAKGGPDSGMSSTGTGGSSSKGTGGSSSGTGGASSKGTGGSTSSGTGGTSSGTGGSTSGTGGSTSGTGGKGGGTGGTSGGTGGTSSTTLPNDGNQLSLCTMAQGDCNKGYGCYSPASAFSAGRGFCSKICTMDSDCAGLSPSSAKYTCPAAGRGGATRVCVIDCMNAMDTTSCPSEMTCQQTAPSTGGTMATFRCKYPLEKSGAWGPCNDGQHECDSMLTCAGTTSSMSGTGYCTASCAMDSDCPKPSTGSITPTCVTVGGGFGFGGRGGGGGAGGTGGTVNKLCGLLCGMATDGCPTGETCTMVPSPNGGMPVQRCEYP